MSIIYYLFAYPSAQLAAFFCGAKLQCPQGGDVWILMMPQPIHVTSSCSGFGFFSLFYGYAVVYLIRHRQGFRTGLLALISLPLVYMATIMTNAARMVCAYHMARVSHALFPAFFQPVIHMAVGIAFFLSAFIISTFLLERTVSIAR